MTWFGIMALLMEMGFFCVSYLVVEVSIKVEEALSRHILKNEFHIL